MGDSGKRIVPQQLPTLVYICPMVTLELLCLYTGKACEMVGGGEAKKQEVLVGFLSMCGWRTAGEEMKISWGPRKGRNKSNPSTWVSRVLLLKIKLKDWDNVGFKK